MLNNLPNLEQFRHLLKFNPHEMMNDVDDVVFHLGILSAATEGMAFAKSVDAEVASTMHNYFAEMLISSAHRINDLIGVEGYDELVKVYNHPMTVRKAVEC